MIVVAGSTGTLGSEICRRLRAAGESVRGLARPSSDQEKVARLEAHGVEIVRGDLKDAASLDALCAGTDVVISTVSMILTAQPGDSFEATDAAGNIALIDAAKRAGATQVIFISFDSSTMADSPLVTAKRAAEDHLKGSGIDYTILHPSYFMESWLGPMLFANPAAGTVTIYGSGTEGVPYVAVADVAEVAVRCVNNPAARNQTIAFGGPALVSQRDALRLFEEVFGKPFTVTEIPEAAIEAQWNGAADPFTRTFSSLTLALARGPVPAAQPPAEQFPMQLTSVKNFVAAQRG